MRIVSRIDVEISYFGEVDVHALQLELGRAVVDTIAVEAVLARDGLPESSTNLVTLSKHCEFPTPYMISIFESCYLRTDRSEGEPIKEKKNSCQ